VADNSEKSKPEQGGYPKTVNFDYVKGTQFRVIAADGAFLALNASGMAISFYSERQPIPRRVVHNVNSDGTVGEELVEQRVVRDAIIRDTEIAVVMNIETAKHVKDALEKMIDKFYEVRPKGKEAKK
jgi:hypothetical protein